jgi:hypothetical protein
MNLLGFQNLVDEAIAASQEERERKGERKSWYVSRIGSCPCGQYLERLGKEPDQPFTKRLLRVFNVGSVFEDWILDLIEAKLPEGATMLRQESLQDEKLSLRGRPDAVVNYTLTSKTDSDQVIDMDEIWETKTIHSRGFWHMAREGRAGYDHHRMQLWLYLYMKQIERGRLIYISKDDLCINEYGVFLGDEKLKAQALGVLATLNKAWETKTPPEPVLDPLDFRYQYCPYHLQCLELAGETHYKKKTGTYKGEPRFKVMTLEERRAELAEATAADAEVSD